MQPDKNMINTNEIKPVIRNGAILRRVESGNTISTVGINRTTLIKLNQTQPFVIILKSFPYCLGISQPKFSLITPNKESPKNRDWRLKM